MDTIDPSDVMFRFLWTVEQMKPYSLKELGPEIAMGYVEWSHENSNTMYK